MDREIAIDLITWEDGPDYEFVETEIIFKSRWTTRNRSVYKNTITDTFWAVLWESGNTEYQEVDESYLDHYQVEPIEVVKNRVSES